MTAPLVRVIDEAGGTWRRLRLDAPPGHLLSLAMVRALSAAAEEAGGRPGLKWLTIEGSRGQFSYGASIPEHLPERFGLFTIILLGESVIAVMAGMKEQEHWTAPAALSAAAGLGLALAVWWCYFDTLKAAAPRHVRTRHEARLLRRWGVAHYPLCLGIALSAVGVEHVITHEGMGPFPALQAWILCGGIALVLASLGVIASASHRRPALPD